MIVNFQVKYNGTDVSDEVISFTRELNICSGIGNLILVVPDTFSKTLGTWDIILIYEDGTKKGTFYISDFTHDEGNGTYIINAQDGSKRITDYFIDADYEVTYPTTARFWIETFLNEAGVTYSFKKVTDYGATIAENTYFGKAQVYDLIIPLLQNSGWYMYFDKDAKCIIGTLDVNLNSYKEKVDDTDILNIQVHQDDSMLRNRAVVWGNTNPITRQQVFADVSVNTPWNFDVNDKRAVVLANHHVNSTTTAYTLANKIIKEFARPTITKTVELHGYHNLVLGDVVLVRSKYWRGAGVITSLSVNTSSSGAITTLILDERCPRIFGYYEYAGYVYVGTAGAGVWRKPLLVDAWENFSTGLDDLYIIDLKINAGVFVCVGDQGRVFYRTIEDSSWTKYVHNEFETWDGFQYNESTVNATGCAINHTTGNIYISYTKWIRPDSWVVELNPDFTTNRTSIININRDIYEISTYDIDTDDRFVYVTVGKITANSSFFPGASGEDFFTTNGLDAWTTTWMTNYQDGWGCFEVYYGKVYYVGLSQITGKYFICIDNFQETPVQQFIGSEFTPTYGDHLSNISYYDPQTNCYWFSMEINSPHTIYVYKYDVDADAIFYQYSFLVTATMNFVYSYKNLILYTHFTQEDQNDKTCTLGAADIITSNGSFSTQTLTFYYPFQVNKMDMSYGLYAAYDQVIIGGIYSGPTPVRVGIPYNNFDWKVYTWYIKVDLNLNFTYDQVPQIEKDSIYNYYYNETQLVGAYTPYGGTNIQLASYSFVQWTLYPINWQWDSFNINLNNEPGVWLDINYKTVYKDSGGGQYMYDPNNLGLMFITQQALSTPHVATGGNGTPLPTSELDKGAIMDLFEDKSYYTWIHSEQAYAIDARLAKLQTPGSGYVDILLSSLSWYNDETIVSSLYAENVCGIVISYTDPSPYHVTYQTRFYRFGDWVDYYSTFHLLEETAVTFSGLAPPGYYTSSGIFTQHDYSIIDTFSTPHEMEQSKTSPVITFSDNQIAVADQIKYLDSTTGLFNTKSITPLMSELNDIRLLDITPNAGFTTISGLIPTSGLRYIGAVANNNLFIAEPTLASSWEYVHTFPYKAIKLETSNFDTIPAFFVALSGVAMSGISTSGIFYQRLPTDLSFVNHSTGLPSSLITVIRLDDTI